MISQLVYRVVFMVFGILLPVYESYKAVKTKDVRQYLRWMMYWIVFGLFMCAETFTDIFLGFWFPFYYEIKVAAVFWLLSPTTKGSSFLYRKFVHPAFEKREPEIDEMISQTKERGYNTIVNFGSRSVAYATQVILQTAVKTVHPAIAQLVPDNSIPNVRDATDGRATRMRTADFVPDDYDENDDSDYEPGTAEPMLEHTPVRRSTRLRRK